MRDEYTKIGFSFADLEKIKSENNSDWCIDLGIDRINFIPLAEVNYFELYQDCEISEELKKLILEEGFELVKSEEEKDCYSRKNNDNTIAN